jgi:hypothetical protein
METTTEYSIQAHLMGPKMTEEEREIHISFMREALAMVCPRFNNFSSHS